MKITDNVKLNHIFYMNDLKLFIDDENEAIKADKIVKDIHLMILVLK